MPPLTCRDLYQVVFDWLDGELSMSEKLKIRFHLLMCGHCRRFVRQAHIAMDYVRRHPEAASWRATSLHDDELEQLVSHLLQHKNSKKI